MPDAILPPPNHVTRFAIIAGAATVVVAVGFMLETPAWFTSGLGWILALMSFGAYLLVFGPAITIASAGNRDPKVMRTTRWVVPMCLGAGVATSIPLGTVLPVAVSAAAAAGVNWWLVDRG